MTITLNTITKQKWQGSFFKTLAIITCYIAKFGFHTNNNSTQSIIIHDFANMKEELNWHTQYTHI
jgi:hypothetical protein